MHRGLRNFLTARHGLGGALGRLLQALDHVFDPGSGLMGATGQGADFVGHHGKTAALFTGTGRFDGGVEGVQIGLFGS